MRTPFRIICLCLIPVAGVWLNACGSGGSSNTQSTPKWTSVSERTACEALDPSMCPGLYGFTIDSAGNYVAGPSPTAVVVKGTITADELNPLVATANDFLASITSTQACTTPPGPVIQTFPGGEGDEIDIVSTSAQTIVVFDPYGVPPPPTVCVSADPAQTSGLTNAVHQLLDKYYPHPFN
jgi:hypothetical protein